MILPVISGSAQAFGYVSFQQACKYEPSVVKINIILNLQIIITFVIDLLFISRDFRWTRVIGAALVFLAGCAIILGKVKRKGEKKEEPIAIAEPISEKIAIKSSSGKVEDTESLPKVVEPAPQKQPESQVDSESSEGIDSLEGIEEEDSQDQVQVKLPEVAIKFSSAQATKLGK
jgi:Ca2+/Na+ antiporter